MKKLIRALYDWTIKISAHRRATWGLAGISFIESSVFPIPPDIVLIPMCIANRAKAFWYATVCTFSSVLGGVLGYAIGYFLYDTIGTKIIDFYGYQEAFTALTDKYKEWGFELIVAKGLTPIPFKIVTIASGVAKFPLIEFVAASIIARAIRFYAVAALIWKFGAPIQVFIEKYLTILALAFLAIVILGFVALKYIV